jgi:hypothetical protein
MDERCFLSWPRHISNRVELQVFPIEIKRTELAKRVEAFRSFHLRLAMLGFATAAAGLYELLLGPARKMLGGRSQLDGCAGRLSLGACRSRHYNQRGEGICSKRLLSLMRLLSGVEAIEVQADRRKSSPKSSASRALLAIR